MSKKLCILISMILFLSLNASSCAKISIEQSVNLSGNLNNGGYFAEADGWVYFSNIYSYSFEGSETPGLFKMKADGSQKTKIFDKPVSNVNVVEDRIYAVSLDQDTYLQILAMKTDGTDIHIINNAVVSAEIGLTVIKNQVFFSNGDVGPLTRMNTDSSGWKTYNEKSSSHLVHNNGWIYYFSRNPNDINSEQEIRRIRVDGSQDSLIASDATQNFIIVGEWIYYTPNTKTDSIHKVGLDGANNHTVANFGANNLNSDGTRIFYTDLISNKIFSMNLEGTDIQFISNYDASSISIAGGWIYYSSNQLLGRSFRVKLDGSGEEKNYSSPPPAVGASETMGIGISNANSNSKGLFAQKDEWIYYSGYFTEKGLFRIHPDGSAKEKILDVNAQSINVVGDWIYFTNASFFYSICRVKTDGTGFSLVLDKSVGNFIIKDKWIYFGHPITKVRTVGTGLMTLEADPSFGALQIIGESIYFSESNPEAPGSGIYKIQSDGTGKSV